MLQRILQLQSYLNDIANDELFLTDDEWSDLSELVQILTFPYRLTLKLQEENLCPAVFFYEWKELMFLLNEKKQHNNKRYLFFHGNTRKVFIRK